MPFCVVFNASSIVLRSARPCLLPSRHTRRIWRPRREIRDRITRILPFGAPTLKDRRATRGGEIRINIVGATKIW